MALSHQFGGQWTEEKLNCVRKYLHAYITIFKSNVRASKLRTTYVDAFAGTGYRTSKDNTAEMLCLFEDKDATSFSKGSAQIALETEPSFDQYIFIERNPEFASELEKLRSYFPHKTDRVRVVAEEANHFLRDWCHNTKWLTNRAVVFLDPYGMEVEWSTIKAIARTKSIDLWILFPLGQAVNRLLTRNRLPPAAWAERLTRFFGTEEWKEAFYHQRTQMTLFGTEEIVQKKEADFESIGYFFVQRLRTVFASVANNPLPLRNSRNVPIYLLCFAAANPKGAPTAVKIAQHILGR